MGKNKEYELAIKIAGEVEKSFYESMHLSKQELQAIAKQAVETTMRMEKITGHSAETSAKIRESLSKGIKESEPFFSGLESAAKKAFDGISKAATLTGAGLTAGLVASVYVGSEFESAFAGVKKTVNASNIELEQMRSSIRGLAKDDIPATAAELSEIAESAGQLGIHNENIIEFTETMANLDVATNLGEDAAAEFAKFANITGMEQEYFDNLGSSVVALGNNMATTEADIMSMGMRISAAGDQIGLSEAQIMAYSAALSSVGIEAEVGGTSFSKLLTNLQLAAETGKKLDEYARIAGMTGNEFKQAFQEDATVAINSFISGLNDTEQNGKSAIAVLDEMGITETRFRDTLLRSGNASELFADALNISNTAWEENTALANEAEQRYKTFESQCQMTQNKLADIGITVYDDLRPALTDGIGLVNEFIDGFADQNMIGEYIESATREIPTMARKAKEAGEALSEFADPLLKVGGWLVDNPGVIVGTIAGVGTALGTYKIASGVASLAKALGSLNPVGMGIMALGGATAVITGISTSVKKAAAEAKQANLDAHFGDISLSISELEETAAAMIQNQNLDKLRESMEAMGVVDDIADDIRDAERELNKLDWKVSVGMELTEDEQEEYQRQVESFVASTQEFLTQDQYALSLSVKVLFGDDTENANAVLDQIDDHFDQLQQKLEEERLKLEDIVSKAREDGIIIPEEAEEIANQREIISQIQNDLMGNEYESKLDTIEAKYHGKNIDAESAINLFSEVEDQRNEQMAMYEEAYADTMKGYRGIFEGEEFNTESDKAQKAFLQQKADLLITSTQRELDIVRSAYGEEYDEWIEEAKIATEEQLKTTLLNVIYWGTPTDALDALGEFAIDYGNVDQSTRDAYADLYSPMETTIQEFQELEQQLKSIGAEIPDEMKELMEELASVGVVAGKEDAAWELLGNLAESEEYQDYLKTIDEAGGYIPEELATAIADNQQLINDAVDASYIATEEMVNQTYGNGFDVTAPLNLTIPTTLSSMKDVAISAEAHKDGGIFTQPHLGLVAEAGYPESIIPINNSPEAIDLWLKTGELLGMDGLTGGAEPLADDIAEAAYGSAGEMVVHIEHNPTLQFYGGTPSKEDIEDVLESDAEEFDRKMQDWLASGRRLKFTDVFG